MFTYPLFKGW